MEQLFKSFEYGIVPTLIILGYLIFTKILDNKKEREISKKSVKINSEILDCFNNLNTYLKHITTNIINKEDDKCIAAIRSSFKSMGFSLTKFGVFTIISNNIVKNKETIEENIKNIVYSEFSTIYSHLILYSNDKINFLNSIKEEWKQDLIDDISEILFDNNLKDYDKMYNIHNKLNLRISNYISIVRQEYMNTKQ